MKKGFSELTVQLLIMFVLGVIVVATFLPLAKGEVVNPYPKAEKKEIEICNNPQDCASNKDGTECISVWQDTSKPFCGCILNEHCKSTGKVERSGICGSDNKCI